MTYRYFIYMWYNTPKGVDPTNKVPDFCYKDPGKIPNHGLNTLWWEDGHCFLMEREFAPAPVDPAQYIN